MEPAPSTSLSVYKNKAFARFARKAGITDSLLWLTAQDANKGKIDADLGGGVIKQRIARSGEGKSGGSRSILLFRQGERAIFFYGFEKKERANIRTDELEGLRKFAKLFLEYSEEQMSELVMQGAVFRVADPKKERKEDGAQT